jgi:hypothetical protein
MPAFDRMLWRTASRIAEALRDQRPLLSAVGLPSGAWEELQRLVQRRDDATRRGWSCATTDLCRQLQMRLKWLVTDLNAAAARLDQVAAPLPAVGDLYQELLALQQEFDEVVINLKATLITVTTDAIALDGLDLGRFDLVWDWSRLDEHDALRVVAREPNGPADRDDITHPHVQDECLCEGEATVPLRQALESGRLGDYFLILRQTLETYNPRSAYVNLHDWHGLDCENCGATRSRDDLFGCDNCDNRVCEDCLERCATCSTSACRSCLYLCETCDQFFCPRCWPTGLQPVSLVCRSCHDAQPSEETVNAPPSVPESPPAPTPAPAEA